MNEIYKDISDKLQNYLDEQGRVEAWPGKGKNQLLVLEYLVGKFEIGKVYMEKEVNDLLNQWHLFEDPALLRRELFMKHLLNREIDGSKYWKESSQEESKKTA